MADGNATARLEAPKQRSVLLGLFVVLQLVFLIVHNSFTVLQEARPNMSVEVREVVTQIAPDWPDRKGHMWDLMEGSTTLTHRWSQATLQMQTWSLFAPNVGADCVFPALLLSDEEPPEAPVQPGDSPVHFDVRGNVVLSDNEPADLTSYVRWGKFRLRRFEGNLVIDLSPRENEKPAETAERFRDRIKAYVHEHAELLLAYLRWRLEQSKQTPPRQVILLMRRYTIKPPDAGADFYSGPYTMPVARWRPDASQRPARQLLEYFDPVTRRFASL